MSADLLTRLSAKSVAELSDAMDTLSGKQFTLSHRIVPMAGQRLFGPAVTLFVDQTHERAAHKIAFDAIREAPSGAVIVAGVEDECDAALWDSEAYTLGAASKISGFVTDGAVRQTHLAETAVFAAARSPASAFGRLKTMAANVQIDCGGVTVRPGDLISGDADGVIAIPQDRLEDLAAALGLE